MDGFDKLYRKSRSSKGQNSPKSDEWLKNVSRSIGKSALDVVNEYIPAVMETGVSVRDIRSDLKDTLLNTKRVGMVKAGSLMTMGKTLWQNSLEDLRTGNLYNQKRIDDSASSGIGDFNFPDFDEDFDFGEDSGSDNYNVDMSSNDGQSSVQMSHKTDSGNDVTQINIETNLGKNSPLVQATQQQTEISIKTAQQLAEVSKTNTQILMTQISKLSTTLSGQLASINDNVSSIATVVSENVSSHVSISNQYYEDSLSEFRQIKDLITDIKDTVKLTSSNNPLERDLPDTKSPFSIFNSGGGLDFKEYGSLIKKQFNSAVMSSPLGFVMTVAKMSSMPGMDMTADLKSSPISSLITMTMKKMVPEVVKTSVEAFNDQMKESLTTGLVKLGGLRNSSNMLYQFIGNLFGIKNTKYTANKKNYNKGPMAWNGIAHRTLVDVIPNYLSQIAAAVTGTEQKVFDYEQGKYQSLRSIREDYAKSKKRNQLSAHWDIRNEFDKFVRNFEMSSDRKDEFTDRFDDYLMKLSDNLGNMNFTNTEQTKFAVGGDEQIAKMIQQFMRFAPKELVTATYGRNALQANEDVSEYERRIERDPTGYNAQYIKNGMTTISPGKNGGLLGTKVDKYNHDNLYYLRRILQTINKAVPVRIIKGGIGFNKKMLSELGADNITSDILRGENGNNTQPRSSSGSMTSSSGMSLDDLDLSPEELKTKVKESGRNRYLDQEEKQPFLMRLMKTFKVKEDSNIYKLASNASSMKKKTGDRTASFFNSLSDTMFSLLFGEGDDRGIKGLFNRAMSGVTAQMKKFGTFIDNKLIGPLNESLFGEEGLITSIKESETIKNFKEKISNAKNKATEFLFGTKDNDGKRSGGLFSETFNSISGMGVAAKDFILHDEDGIVGSLKGMYRSVTASVKKSLGVEDKDTEKVPISKKIASGASDFLTHIKSRGSEWMDLIFGGKDTKLEDAKEDFISGFDIFKEDMKGKKGKLGASATLGVLGSFFLPGGPIAGALLGLGTGIVSESSQLKDFLFGKLGENDERGGGLISKEFQDFFKDHKTGISIGAFAGTAASIGLIPSFFVPGGPIGGALIGGAMALAHKSGVFNSLLYGEDGSEDNITGGITKFIKDHYKKDGNIKSTFMDAGIGAGVGIVGSFFLPGGPIVGALLGSAASIAINTDKFKNLMFGEEVLDENGNSTGKRKGGLFGKFTGYIGDKVLLPLSNAAKETQVKILGFIEEHMVNPLKVAMKPFQLAGKNFMDGVHSTIDDLKESFKKRVTKPIGDAVEEHILKPMRNAFSKIFGGLGKIFGSIISAPFKMLQGAATGLNKGQKKKGQTDYNVQEELDKENEKTRAKYDKKLHDVQEENKKRTKWKNPLNTSRKVKQKETESQKNTDTAVSGNDDTQKTEPVIPMNIQFFAKSKKGDSDKENTTTVSTDSSGNDETKKKNSPLSMKFFSRKKDASNKSSQDDDTKQSESAVSNLFNTDSLTKHLKSIDKNVESIKDSVDGQLNGVGYNVNKILRILLKKNGMKEEDVAGENNKRYSRGGKLLNRLKGIIFAPFNIIKGGIDGAIGAVKGVIGKATEGVTKIAQGLIKIPKMLLNAGVSIVKGVGSAALNIAKGAAKAVSTGLTAVGNVITHAASGFGEMIGEASKGFGQLIGGALGGLGQLLHGVGLITKELAPVIAKGISTIVKTPFKLVGAAGSFVSSLFGKRKGGKGKDTGKVSHVIVDQYNGEDRVIDALRAIEFAILHGAPMDGEGPKFKGTSVIPVSEPGEKEEKQEEQEEQATKMSLPFNLQFFANKGKNGNGLPNVAKAQTKEQEQAELQTRVAEGSASEINERFDAEDEKKEDRSFREKLLGLFKSNNKEQKKQGINWSAIFSKKGIITGGLIALAPLIIKLLPGLLDFIQNVGGKLLNWLSNTAQDVLNNAESQGGLNGIMNGLDEVKTSVANLVGTKDREEYKIGENGEIISDENGNPLTETKKDGLIRRISEFFVPTTTKIDHETGEAYQERQYDATTRAKIHATRTTAKKVAKKGKKAATTVKKTLNHIPGGKRLQQGTSNLAAAAKLKVSNKKDAIKTSIGNEYTKLYDNRIAGKNGMSQKFMRENGQNATLVKEMTDSARLDDLRNGNKAGYKAFDEDIITRAKDHATIAKEKISNTATKIKTKGAQFVDNHETLGKAVDAVKTTAGNLKSKAGNLASSAKTATAAKIKDTKIEKIISMGTDAFKFVKDKLAEFFAKHAKGANSAKVVKFLDDAIKAIFKPSTVTKFLGKFSKLLSKIATMASTLATSEIFWGITGALEGATNAAYTFEVSDADVDWKMRLIAGFFRALLATSVGGWVDLADSILYEITGTSFVNQLAVLMYDLLSSDEDSQDLQEARKRFNENYDKYVEEEYQAYAENQEANGQEAMSFDDYKASSLATSRQEYNSQQNKSLVKRVWDGAQSLGRKVSNSKAGKFIGATIKKTNETIVNGAKAVGGAVVGGAKKLGGAVVGGAKKIGTTIKTAYDNSALKGVVDGTMNAGKLVITGIAGILKNAWTGDKDDLITLPKDTEDPSTIFAKYALIGANVLATPLKLVIKVARKVTDTAKMAWNGMKLTGQIVGHAVTGRLSAAWNGEDYEPPAVDESQPITKIASILDAGIGFLMSPVTFTVKGVKKAIETAKMAWNGMKLTGQIVGHAVTGRLSAAWNGEDYEPPEVDESQPITKVANILDTGIGFLMSPITFTVKGVSQVVKKVKQLAKGIAEVAGQVKTSATGRIKAAWNGEDYEPEEFDEDTPHGKLLSVVDGVTGFLISPVALVTKGVHTVLNGVKSVFNVAKDVGASIATYANVFDGKTAIKDYWKMPDEEDGPIGVFKSIMFYVIRTAMFVPFMITKLVTTIKDGVVNGVKWVADKVGGVFNNIANIFGDGNAFNVDDGGNGTGILGGFGDGDRTAPKKTNLNGFTYYSQNDTSIKDQSYNQTDGTPGTMGERGCGPTALSMVASEVTGQDYDPISMAKLSEGLGYSTDVGTTTGYFGQVGSTLGMDVSGGQANPTAIRNSLSNGNPVILQGMGNGGPYTSGGHYVVGVGMKDGKVLVNDPRGAQYSKAYSMSEIMDGASGMWSFSGGKGPSTTSVSPSDGTATTSNNEAAEQAVVKAIYSVKEKNQYSQSAREHVGDTLTGAAQGSGDCSSTVRWAYKQALGIDPGSYTGEQVNSPTGYTVDQGSGGPPNESNLRPGDLLFYTRSGRNTHAASDVGHVEMYVGNNTLMGHGSGIGPKERQMSTYRLADYIGARRFIGDGANVVNNFNGVSTGSAGSALSSSTGTTASSPLSGGFSLSNLFSGAVNAVSDGINKFFGIDTSSTTSGDTSTSVGGSVNIDPSNEKQTIWSFFRKTMGYTPEATAAIMGNMEQESGNHAVRLQGDYSSGYQKSIEYTNQADAGAFEFGGSNDPGKGYGLIQWTYPPIKKELMQNAKAAGKSVGDLGVQLGTIKNALEGNSVLGNELTSMNTSFKTNTDMLDATKQWLNLYEKPGGDRNAEANKRLGFAQAIYDQYKNSESATTSAMSGDPRYSTSTSNNNRALGTNGGFGEGKKNKLANIVRYQSNNTVQPRGIGEGSISSKQHIRIPQIPSTTHTSTGQTTNSSGRYMSKIFDYLTKIVAYLESTSTGIDKLNQKDFGTSQNYISSPSYTNVTGGTQQPEKPDTSNYELGKQIAYGQLV